MRANKLARVGVELAIPSALVVAWWTWSTSSYHLYYPPAPDVLVVFRETWLGFGFGEHVVPSLQNLGLGYLLGVLGGVSLGVVIGSSRSLNVAITPLLNYLRSLPPPALLPLFILVAGIGWRMKVAFIAFGVLWPVLLNTIDGIRGIDLTVRDVVRVYRVRPLQRLGLVTLPAASPAIVAGMRIGLSLGVLLMVVSELVASTRGLGYFVLQAQRSFDMPAMWAGILLVGLLSYALNVAFEYAVERRVLFWQVERTGRGRI